MERYGFLEIQDLSLGFGGIQALSSINLSVRSGELFAIIGPNGAGKTSLLNCISGFYKPDSGRVYFRGRNLAPLRPDQVARVGIARTFQNVELFRNMTVVDNMLLGRHNHFLSGFLANVFLGYRDREESENRRKVEEVLDFLEMEKWAQIPGLQPALRSAEAG